jgi:hypothetical protein
MAAWRSGRRHTNGMVFFLGVYSVGVIREIDLTLEGCKYKSESHHRIKILRPMDDARMLARTVCLHNSRCLQYKATLKLQFF